MDTEEATQQKIVVHVEVLLRPSCSEEIKQIENEARSFLESSCSNYHNGPLSFSDNDYLYKNVEHIHICDISENQEFVPFWRAELSIHVYTLNTDGSSAETLDGAGDVTAYHEWMLPCQEFDNLWDQYQFKNEVTISLIFDSNIKSDLLNYATSAFIFSQSHVNTSIISLNRVLLLHGPPGTGKTSICKALAEKLSIRYFSLYSHIALIEINSHSLFSKWFSESGKLVMKLFDYIHDLLSNDDTMLFILIDEVESLSASRKASLSGTEPSDGMRVVNALLTQVDKLRNNPNVMILTTSNLSSSIDEAFIDRADIKRFIGNPGEHARFCILKDCVEELIRVGIITDSVKWDSFASLQEQSAVNQLMLDAIKESNGLSGRALRKLPFQAYSQFLCGQKVNAEQFLDALRRMILKESEDRKQLVL